jgi:maltose alpha-D-glucosyltransferase/alpha-amylase
VSGVTDAESQPVLIDAGDNSTGEPWISQLSTRTLLEREVLPGYLARTRWYPERSAKAVQPTIISAIPFVGNGDDSLCLTVFRSTRLGETTRYVLPMQIAWGRDGPERRTLNSLATVRRGTREGTLLDVATDPIFIKLLLRNLRDSQDIEANGLRLEFRPTTKFAESPIKQPENIRAVQTEQSNSTALVDSDYVVKIYRKLEPGINPEIEMGQFLTDVAGFANTPAMLGSVELVDGDTKSAVAIVHAFIQNEGDGWSVASKYLDHFFEQQRRLPAREYTSADVELVPYLRVMARTGKRLAEMHVALSTSGAPEFVPEPIVPADVRLWIEEITTRAERVFDALQEQRDMIREADRSLVDHLLAQRAIVFDRLAALLPYESEGLKIRHHGDLHLGQILIAQTDIFIIDFEGEPRRSIDERRRKAPPARDVAGVLRSIDYCCTAALQRALKLTPDHYGKFNTGLNDWRDCAMAAFMKAYREVMSKTHLWPADPQTANRLLNFFLIEKVLYETEYELVYRPDWLHVPLTGLFGILRVDQTSAS